LTTVVPLFKNPGAITFRKFPHRKELPMPSRKLFTLLISLTLLISASLSLYGQSTYGSISGSVTDTSGAIVTDAKVTLTNLGTSEKHTQSSGSDGLFTFVNLFPGQYRVDVEKQGFKHFVRSARSARLWK
jgi:hypothetical protein